MRERESRQEGVNKTEWKNRKSKHTNSDRAADTFTRLQIQI